jgi:hypothetical protein
MNLDTAHEELARRAIQEPLTDETALSWMVLLHTHEIHFRAGTILDDDGSTNSETLILLAATQRGVAEVIAALWPDRTDKDRCNYVHWYWEFNLKGPYEVLSDVPPELLESVLRLRDILAQDPRVIAVIEEEE